jgi:formiminoglutamase
MKIDFAFLDSIRINTFLRPRDGEKKIGEHIFYASESIEKSLADFKGQFVLLGVEEDIGPRANLGNSGAIYAFKSFLSRFLNMQDNRFVNLHNIMMLGRVKAETLETGFAKRRQNVAELDAYLKEILIKVYKAGKIPILVGGGHNNAYPLIAAYYEAKAQTLDVLNLDAHADFRPLEGRHSGNAFSYAMHEKMINSYTIHGLHSAYCNEEMLEELDKNKVEYTLFEQYLDGQRKLSDDAIEFARKHNNEAFGIELDMDAIAFMPSSAYTPSGWSVSEARLWIRNLTKHQTPAYLNLTEGSCELNTWSDAILGKTLAFFVYDLIAKPMNI